MYLKFKGILIKGRRISIAFNWIIISRAKLLSFRINRGKSFMHSFLNAAQTLSLTLAISKSWFGVLSAESSFTEDTNHRLTTLHKTLSCCTCEDAVGMVA